MASNNVPKQLWYYHLVYKSRILLMIAWGSDGVTGLESITKDTFYITKWLDFAYNLVLFYNKPGGLLKLGH